VKYRLKKQRQQQEQAKKIRAPGADFCVFKASALEHQPCDGGT
jgi:hypothetical protein